MNTLLWWLVQNTLTIAILIPIVAAASRLCRNRPALEHVLWLVVLLKFITPPLAVWPIPLPIVSLTAQSRITPLDGLPLASTGAHPASESDQAPLPMAEGPAISGPLRPVQPLAVPATALSTALARLLTGLWAVGFVVCAAQAGSPYRPPCRTRPYRKESARGPHPRDRTHRLASRLAASAQLCHTRHRLALHLVSGEAKPDLARGDV